MCLHGLHPRSKPIDSINIGISDVHVHLFLMATCEGDGDDMIDEDSCICAVVPEDSPIYEPRAPRNGKSRLRPYFDIVRSAMLRTADVIKKVGKIYEGINLISLVKVIRTHDYHHLIHRPTLDKDLQNTDKAIDRVTITSLLSNIYFQYCRCHVVGIVQCKRDEITRILPCLFTAALGTTIITHKTYAVD